MGEAWQADLKTTWSIYTMKHYKKILATALLTIAGSSAQAFEEINFDDQTVGNYSALNTSLTINEVTFESISGTDVNPAGGFIISNYAPVNEVSLDYSGNYLTNGGTGFSSLKMSFETPVTEFSFNLADNNDDWKLTAFDSGDNLIDSFTISGIPTSGSNNGEFFGISSLSNTISYATLTTQGASGFLVDDINIDNLRYKPEAVSPIPEPSTYALMLSGVGMVGFMAYRRRKQITA